MPDWFRNKIITETSSLNERFFEKFRSCNPERLFGSFIPDDGPFADEQEKTNWRMEHWGTIHEATHVIFSDPDWMGPGGEDAIALEITFTSYQTIPRKFIDFFENQVFLNGFDSFGISIVGAYGNIDDMLFYDNHAGIESIIDIRNRLTDRGWRQSDDYIIKSMELMEFDDRTEYLDHLRLPHPHLRFYTIDPDGLVYNIAPDEPVNEKTKAIRKSSRNAFLGTYIKLIEAPDTEYICLICHADKSEEVLDPTKVLLTACGHLFHRSCIKKWVKDARERVRVLEKDAHNLCPACRTDIIAFHGPESKLNSQETDAVETPKE